MTPREDRDRLAILVHEVRSPVAALAAIAAAFVHEDLAPAERRSLAGLAAAACRGIERVVTDATVASIRREDVDVARVVEESTAAAILGGGNVRAVVTSGRPRLRADPLRLRQALDNLVSNALKHSTPGEEVIVSLHAENDVVLISVSDTGPGIPPDEQERIFEPGVRLDPRRSGTGLGLAIARAIAEAHGGTLTVESTPGRGSRFTLTLPARQPATRASSV